ncbi:YbeD family protein [Arcobacter sp. YIC-464]|uniref:HP0495 family protein n=1 Tax=Arcobacter sp. YIC-464 TaxID=3376631 RepID=UPI003C2A887E
MIDLNKEKLKLDYPCNWKYKIVVLETINIKKVVTEVISKREHSVKESKVSKKGKFKSYTLELLVHSDDDRTGLYENLGNHDDIKMVL